MYSTEHELELYLRTTTHEPAAAAENNERRPQALRMPGGPREARPESPLWSVSTGEKLAAAEELLRHKLNSSAARKAAAESERVRCGHALPAPGAMQLDANPPQIPKPQTGMRFRVLLPTLHNDSGAFEPEPEGLQELLVPRAEAISESRQNNREAKAKHPRPRTVYDFPLGKDSRRTFALQETVEVADNKQFRPLLFESRFECGNLQRAVQVGEKVYELHLQHDTNTMGNTQWFYFRVSNGLPGQKYVFRIVNLGKKDSLYSSGMRPLVLSMNQLNSSGRGWHRGGEQVLYYADQRRQDRRVGKYHTLEWIYQFGDRTDSVYFAHCYPYSYSRLQTEMGYLQRDTRASAHLRRDLLCTSKAGNRVDVLWISDQLHQTTPQQLATRPIVLLSGRVHPGESGSSFVVRGAIHWLLSDHPLAIEHRKQFHWCIVPMLNPDGVVNGNYRAGLLGLDGNRRWACPLPEQVPEIYALKRLLHELSQPVSLFVDVHGHSRKCGCFLYGCGKGSELQVREEAEHRLLSYILSRQCASFDRESCRYTITPPLYSDSI